MHLETLQHLRSLAGQHDDLVPIAKPLLLDLLDSYERHELRSLNASVRILGAASKKHAEQMLLLAQFCQCEVSYTDGGNGEDYFLSHGTQQLRLSARANKADGAFLRIQARPSECEDLPAAPDAAASNSAPDVPDALNLVILQQLLKADDYDTIEAVKAAAQDYLHSLNACQPQPSTPAK